MDFSTSEEKFILQGDDYFNAQDFELALQEYKRVLEFSPEKVQVLYRVGCAYSQLLDVDLTIKFFNKVIAQEPHSAEAEVCLKWIENYNQLKKSRKSKIEVEIKFATEEEKCFTHQEEKAVYLCKHCNKPLCLTCVYPANNTYYCISCYQQFKEKRITLSAKKDDETKKIYEKIDMSNYKKAVWFILGLLFVLAVVYKFNM